ncbi:MAG TPA: hypothetical protein VLM76_11080 [Patescibacteria group bacterium]|nr:hypothetical protein [Patescibacteria group bacterium]
MIDPATPRRAAVERTSDLRVARLHLRGGTHALARVELEGLAGRDGLDRDGILDLAEVRWRTGDLAGAAVAAAAWLDDGDDTGAPGVLAHVICAEAAAARGAMEAAASHLDAAAPRLGDCGTLDAILAGIAARAAWPQEAAAASPPAAAPAAAVADAASPPVASAIPAADETPIPALPPGAPGAPAAAQLARAGAGLVGEAPERAVVLLALALRADRAAAEAVLAALDAADPGSTHAAAFAFVRAEALQAAGRHDESRIAYASAESLALAPVQAGAPRSPK